MKCPSCGYDNLTDFPFCEQCLEVLPGTESGPSDPFERGARLVPARGGAGSWPPFPWNPPDLPRRLIGRERAVDELLAAWDETVACWRGRVHLLVGGYGTGKTQVARAFAEAAVERVPEARVVTVRASEVGGALRLWDVVLRQLFDIAEDADPLEAGARFEEQVVERLAEAARDTAAAVAWLVGWQTPDGPSVQRAGGHGPGAADSEALTGRATGALSRLLAAYTRDRPLLLVVNDADQTSGRALAIVDALDATLKGRPLMLLLSGSEALGGVFPGWERFSATRLGALTTAGLRELLDLFLTGIGDPPPKELAERIAERSGGNPAALKSILRYVRQAGGISAREGVWTLDETTIWDLDLPDDLEGVVVAVVASLAPYDRQILASAAMVGRRFWLGALVTLERQAQQSERPAADLGMIPSDGVPKRVRESLARLIEHRFIEALSPNAPGAEPYAFRSEVHWRVANEAVPAAKRQTQHRVAYEWLKVHAAGQLDAYYEDLAAHAEAAGMPGEAARWLLRAARAAGTEHRAAEERRLLESAHALADPDDYQTRLSVTLDLGDLLARTGDSELALARYQEALQVSWRLRHRGKGAAALTRIGRVETTTGAFEAGYAHLMAALRLFEAIEDLAGVADACDALGRMFWLQARFDEATRCYRKAEEIYRRRSDRLGLARVTHALAAVIYDRGDLDEAERYYREALELRRRLDDRRGIAGSSNDLGIILQTRGRSTEAVEAFEDATVLAAELGDLGLQATVANNLGEALLALDRVDDAEEALDLAIDLAAAVGRPRLLADAHLNRATLRLRGLALDAALNDLEQAASHARALGLPRPVALVERGFGDLAVARAAGVDEEQPRKRSGLLRDAAEAYGRSADALGDGGYELEEAISRQRLADVLDRLGRTDQASEERRRAIALREPA